MLGPPSTLKRSLLFTIAQTRLAVPRASKESPASVSHFSTGMQGIWRYVPPCPVLCGLWGFEPGLHADSINTLLTEPPPPPPVEGF